VIVGAGDDTSRLDCGKRVGLRRRAAGAREASKAPLRGDTMDSKGAKFAILTACAGVIIAVCLLLTVATGVRGAFAPKCSSYRSDEYGTRALFLLLESRGMKVRRLERSLSRGKDRGLLIMVDPHFPEGVRPDVLKSPAARLREWAAAGNRVLIASNSTWNPVLEELGVSVDRPLPFPVGMPPFPLAGKSGKKAFAGKPVFAADGEDIRIPPPGEKVEAECMPAAVTPIAAKAPALATYGNAELRLLSPGWLPIYARRGKIQVAMRREGDGEIWVLSDVYPLLNRGIGDGCNAEFLVALAEEAGPCSEVLFDEFHLGLGAFTSVWGYARKIGLGPFILALAVTLGVAAWTFGARAGRPIAGHAGEVKRREASEFVRGLANFYRRVRLGRHLAATAFREFRRALCRKAGVPTSAGREELLAACARRWPGTEEKIRSLMLRAGRIEAAPRLHDGDVLAFFRELSELEEKTIHG
jgi:hypothetical protein